MACSKLIKIEIKEEMMKRHEPILGFLKPLYARKKYGCFFI